MARESKEPGENTGLAFTCLSLRTMAYLLHLPWAWGLALFSAIRCADGQGAAPHEGFRLRSCVGNDVIRWFHELDWYPWPQWQEEVHFYDGTTQTERGGGTFLRIPQRHCTRWRRPQGFGKQNLTLPKSCPYGCCLASVLSRSWLSWRF